MVFYEKCTLTYTAGKSGGGGQDLDVGLTSRMEFSIFEWPPSKLNRKCSILLIE